MIEIIYQDDFLVVVNKAPGLLMHKSFIAKEVEENLKDKLSQQLGVPIFLVHRLDRKTAGLVVCAFDKETARHLADQFARKEVRKVYLAICRGHLAASITINKPLENERGNLQDAETYFEPLAYAELAICTGKYPSTRLSLVACKPRTGRMHQIRRHLAHLRHYIINDKPHGDCKVNKVFKDELSLDHMMLHASEMDLIHPKTKKNIHLKASFFEQFAQLHRFFEPN
jgi:tRNA pseudouridine65 synthase